VCVDGVLVCSDVTDDDNRIVDGGFEGGFMGGFWTESSTNFDSPICSIDDCGTGTTNFMVDDVRLESCQ
jgi:hypothetical protein